MGTKCPLTSNSSSLNGSSAPILLCSSPVSVFSREKGKDKIQQDTKGEKESPWKVFTFLGCICRTKRQKEEGSQRERRVRQTEESQRERERNEQKTEREGGTKDK